MFKSFFNDLKLNRISYLLETIEVGDFKKKVDAFNKLSKMKINEDAGHIIIDKVMALKHKKNDNYNSDISLLSLLFKNYYDSYSEHLYKAFKNLNTNSKYEFLKILSTSNDPSQLILYRLIIYKNYKDLKDYPIGNINSNPNNYELLFPELYETFKENNNRNALLLLLSDFINQGVVPLLHLNKHKKVLQNQIISIFKEGIKYKINTKDNFMSNKEYIDLRIFLEVAVNIEFYVSSKETKSYLDKLYKTKDNQLKLFILENYARKGKDISKININSIARDNLSRYPLYSFLVYNKLEKLMPKKYRNNKELSLSDLYLNYSIKNAYYNVPYDFELLEERIINDYKYYIYKFKAPFDYNMEIVDPVTDYLLKSIKMDETLKEGEITYVGISGGFNKIEDPSLIEKNLSEIKIAKLDDDIEIIVNRLLKSETEIVKSTKEEKIVEVETKKEIKESKFSNFNNIFNFSRILTLFSVSIIILLVILLLYISNIDLFNIRKNKFKQTNIIHAVLLKQKDLFSEINYKDIFNREETDYYVLFFKKKDKSMYFDYLNTVLKNDYKFYYVDLSKEENKAIYEGNETGFVISGDTLLKVKNHDYSFYVVGKSNIIKELKSYVDDIKKKEAEKKKQEEKEKEEKTSNEEKKES